MPPEKSNHCLPYLVGNSPNSWSGCSNPWLASMSYANLVGAATKNIMREPLPVRLSGFKIGRDKATHYMLNGYNVRFTSQIFMKQNEQIHGSSRSLRSNRPADLLHVAMAFAWPYCPHVKAWSIAGYGQGCLWHAGRQLAENKAATNPLKKDACQSQCGSSRFSSQSCQILNIFMKARRRANIL